MKEGREAPALAMFFRSVLIQQLVLQRRLLRLLRLPLHPNQRQHRQAVPAYRPKPRAQQGQCTKQSRVPRHRCLE